MSRFKRHKLSVISMDGRTCGTCGRLCYSTLEVAQSAAKGIEKERKVPVEPVACLDRHKYYSSWTWHLGKPGDEAARKLEYQKRMKAYTGWGLPPRGKNKVSPKKGRWTKVKDHDDEGERQAL